jgi:hypothetical protein
VNPILQLVQTVWLEHSKQLELTVNGQDAQVNGSTTEVKYPAMQVLQAESL